jgi:cellobiose-specific phosphotransferase system component IIA
MAQQAMDAAKQGNTEQAERSIAQLEQALDALRNAHPMTAQERAAQAQRQKGRQQMSAMQDLLGRQGGLLDHAQGRTREKARSGEESPNAGADRTQDSQVQQALRRALGEVMQQLGDMTGKIPPSLGEADRDMQGAATALKQGQDGAAQDAELKAIQALQKGGHEASQQLADKFGRGQQQGEGQGDGSGDQMYLTDDDGQDGNGDQAGSYGMQPGFTNGGTGRGRDPLGRRAGPGGNGMDEADDVTVPDKAGPKRTEEIEQELRRRDGQRTRPREELDYIERLLKQF